MRRPFQQIRKNSMSLLLNAASILKNIASWQRHNAITLWSRHIICVIFVRTSLTQAVKRQRKWRLKTGSWSIYSTLLLKWIFWITRKKKKKVSTYKDRWLLDRGVRWHRVDCSLVKVSQCNSVCKSFDLRWKNKTSTKNNNKTKHTNKNKERNNKANNNRKNKRVTANTHIFTVFWSW